MQSALAKQYDILVENFLQQKTSHYNIKAPTNIWKKGMTGHVNWLNDSKKVIPSA